MAAPFALKSSQIVFLEKLDLSTILGNQPLSTTNMATFAAAISIGALPLLRKLQLKYHLEAGEGMEAFFKALGNGALPRLETLNLDYTNLGNGVMKVFSKAIGEWGTATYRGAYSRKMPNCKAGDGGLF